MSMDWRRKGNSSVGESDVDPHACALGSPGQVEIRYDCFMIVISFLASHIDTTVLVDGKASPGHKLSISNYAFYILLICAFTVLRI